MLEAALIAIPPTANHTARERRKSMPSRLPASPNAQYPANTRSMPRPCTALGLSPYMKNATTKTSAGAEARMGVAIVTGSVLSAQ